MSRAPRRRPGRFRRWFVRPLVWSLVVFAALVLAAQRIVDTGVVRDRLRERLIHGLGERLGEEVAIDDIEVRLLPFQLELRGLKIGAAPDSPIFLSVPRVVIEADVTALEHGKLRLERLFLDRPEMELVFFEAGGDNLLRPRRSGRDRRFDVFIDRLEVADGRFLALHERARVSFSAHGVEGTLDGRGEMRIEGEVHSDELIARLPGAPGQSLIVHGSVTLTREGLIIDRARTVGPHIVAEGDGQCTWRGGKRCIMRARGRADARQLDALGYFRDLRGDVDFDGEFEWRSGSFGWRGTVESPQLRLFERDLGDVRGVLSADRFGLRLDALSATYAGGALAGSVSYDRRDEVEPITVDLMFEGLRADDVLADQAIPLSGIACRLDGRVRYRFQRHRPRAGDGEGEIRMRPALGEALNALTLVGRAPILIEAGSIASSSIVASSLSQSLLADGAYDLTTRSGRFDYEIATADLAALVARLPLGEAPHGIWPTAGKGGLFGVLELAVGEVRSQMRLDLQQVAAPVLDSPQPVRGTLMAGPNGVDNLRIELGDADRALLVRGTIPLGEVSSPRLDLILDAVAWPLDSARDLIPFTLPVDGPLTGRIEVTMDGASSSGRVDASVRPAVVSLGAALGDLDVDALAARLTWRDELMKVESIEFRLPAGVLAGGGQVDRGSGGLLDLEIAASALNLELPPFDRLPTRGMLGMVAESRFEIGGSLESPNLRFLAGAERLRVGKVPDARWLNARSRVEARLSAGTLALDVSLAERLTLVGGGPLDGTMELAVSGRDLSALAPLVGLAPGDADGAFGGRLRIDSAAGGLVADLELDSLEASFAHRSLANRGPARLRATASGLEVLMLDVAAPSSSNRLSVRGALGWGPSAPIDLTLDGELDAAWMPPLAKGVTVRGGVQFAGRLAGSREAPEIDLAGTLEHGAVILPDEIPYELTNVRGNLRLDQSRLWFDDVHAEGAGGQLRASGWAIAPWRLSEAVSSEAPRLSLQIAGRDLAVRYPDGWRLVGDTDLAITTDAAGAATWIRGRASLREARFDEDLPIGFAEVLAGILARERVAIEHTADTLAAIALDVAVEVPSGLAVTNNLADLEGSAELLLEGTLARPRLLGTVDFLPGGRLVWNSTEYEVERARLTFADPLRTDPEVDLLATTRVREYDVQLALAGRVDRLEANFSSNPPLPDLEVFRLLATGETDGVGRIGGAVAGVGSPGEALGSTSAAGLLYGQAASVVGERVGALFGLDTFRVAPLTGSGDALSRTRVTVGKRLSRDLFVTYSADPSSTEDQRLQVEWQIGRNLVLVLTQNGDDSFSADARFEQTF